MPKNVCVCRMKSTTPEISWHNRDPILSIDIQQKPFAATSSSQDSDLSSYRVASSGSDAHIIIWRADMILSSNRIKSFECVADLDRHERPVNVVRFCPTDEDMLASGDDDGEVFIWKLVHDANDVDASKDLDQDKDNVMDVCDGGQNDCHIIEDNKEPSGSKGNNNCFQFDSELISKECWKRFKRLQGHGKEGDVSDLCWSPDGQLLLSGSVDNTAIVWDVKKGHKICVLTEHKGYVQGVAWDPLNKYLATLSADRNLRIINVNNKRTAYRVYKMCHEDGPLMKSSRLFYDDTLRSFCRRLCFSPGGEFLIAPSGILEQNDSNEGDNNEGDVKYINTTYIFERKSINK